MKGHLDKHLEQVVAYAHARYCLANDPSRLVDAIRSYCTVCELGPDQVGEYVERALRATNPDHLQRLH